MITEEKERNPDDYNLLTTPPFKLKDKPPNRRFQMIDLRKQFKDLPEVIIVEKIRGSNNMLIVRAFVPKQAKEEPGQIKVREDGTDVVSQKLKPLKSITRSQKQQI